MKPVNEKSLFHFLCAAMDDVASGAMQPAQAREISGLAREAEKLLRGERERARLLMEMDEHERNFGKRPAYRELAALGFADTTKDAQTGNPRNDDASYIKQLPR